MSQLFETYQLGAVQLENRVLMAPLTRSRASTDGVHGDLAATYYRQRSGAGLIITEATAVSKQGSGYVNIPGIWNDAQVEGWKKSTQAVHEAGGKIFMQLFHTGRIGHSSLFGEQPVSSTTKLPEGQVMGADYKMHDYEAPRMLRTDEIPGIIQQFRTGAENAKKAGFDGIEIHSANGYLLDQFLRDGTNERKDEYGGPIENRVRLLKEVVGAAMAVWGPGRVGVRFSPQSGFNSMSDSDPLKTFTFAASAISEFPLAYIHLIDGNGYEVSRSVRKVFKGPLLVNSGLTLESGTQLLKDGIADAVVYGSLYISNPDLVERFRKNLPLAKPDSSTFYGGDAKGYTDYPTAEKRAA